MQKQGDWTWSLCKSNNLLGVAWWDSGVCCFMSNCHNPDPEKASSSAASVVFPANSTVPAPKCAVEYNEWMGAVNDVDQVRVLCSTRLRSPKWYMAIFFFLLNSSLNNALTLFKIHHAGNPQGNIKRRPWMAMLCDELLVEAGWDRRDKTVSTMDWKQTFGTGPDFKMCPKVKELLARGTKLYIERTSGRMHYLGTTEGKDDHKNCVLCYHTHPCKKGELQCEPFLQAVLCFFCTWIVLRSGTRRHSL